jgi:hypothetical protein
MAAFFDTGYPRLEIEQMPHGQRDALKIGRWTDQVLAIAEAAISLPPNTDKATPHENPARRYS